MQSVVEFQKSTPVISDKVRLWILRTLIRCGGINNLDSLYEGDALIEALELRGNTNPCNSDFDKKQALQTFRFMLLESDDRQYYEPESQLTHNLQKLSLLIGLSQVETHLLEFAILLQHEPALESAVNLLENMGYNKLLLVLSLVLDLSEQEVRTALSPEGLLNRSGLLVVERSGSNYLSGRMELLSYSFASQIVFSDGSPETLLRDVIHSGSSTTLTRDNFEHIKSNFHLLEQWINHAFAMNRRGVNVLLYGEPGTGKSELSRLMAELMEVPLLEVSSEDIDGDPISGEKRLRALRASGVFFANKPCILAFDEAEDVFDSGNGPFFGRSIAQSRKAWINRTLEENVIPTFWLTNSVESIDPAFIRRFDLVIELKVPPRAQRAKMIQLNSHGLLDESSAYRLAASEHLVPAIIHRAAGIACELQGQLGDEPPQDTFERLTSNTLKAQGHSVPGRYDPSVLPNHYDPELINASENLSVISDGLIRRQAGRLCIYGPSGTGKTAYARWLAEQLNKPLVICRASDLLGKYVGESEKNVAHAFKKAVDEDGVLLLDEVDSFLTRIFHKRRQVPPNHLI
ncbi:AAA family ATPase [Endozoicomonas montiporae]|uniref:AAA family ATPase n=1 Tax=Endozoicomonas montiporae TaxID=1027273 RepID=UPI000690F50B|nr:ATP-binding protein [Endozoicomonas montiporae]